MKMRKRIVKLLLSTFVLVALMLVGYSCSTSDDYLDEFEVRRLIEEALRENNKELEFTKWKIVNITVNKGDWKWSDDESQWEAIYDLPDLTEFIYENGALIGYLF